MIANSNKYYSLVKDAVSSLCQNSGRVMQRGTPQLPYLYFKELGQTTSIQNLDGEECQVLYTAEIQIYTNGTGALNKNEKIMEMADNEMTQQGFERIYGPQIVEQDDSIIQNIARYSKYIEA